MRRGKKSQRKKMTVTMANLTPDNRANKRRTSMMFMMVVMIMNMTGAVATV